MLTESDIENIVRSRDQHHQIHGDRRHEWITICMRIVESEETSRTRVEEDGEDLDASLRASLGECTDIVIETINGGHSLAFALLYGRERFLEDHERAMFNAYAELAKTKAALQDPSIVYREAFLSVIKEGKSPRFAGKYATMMQDEPWDQPARSHANAYEEAYLSAIAQGKSEVYAGKYAQFIGYCDYERGFCKMVAKTYEECLAIFPDTSDAEDYAEFFAEEYFDFSCRSDIPELEEPYYRARAFAHMDIDRSGRPLNQNSAIDKYVDGFITVLMQNGNDLRNPNVLAKARGSAMSALRDETDNNYIQK